MSGCANNEQTVQDIYNADKASLPKSNLVDKDIDICRCLFESINTEWYKIHSEACNDLISRKLGVGNWEDVNFSKRPDLKLKWNKLAQGCKDSQYVTSEVSVSDKNEKVASEITKSQGYIWEYINYERQIYSLIVFDGSNFDQSDYLMNGKEDVEDFTLGMKLSGKWIVNNFGKITGLTEIKNYSIHWILSPDYSTLSSDEGVIFKRVNIDHMRFPI